MPLEWKFAPRWREELVCTCQAGVLVLEMPMGKPCVYLPTEASWPARAPAWAAPHWNELHDQLRAWCAAERLPLHVDATAHVDAA